MHKFVTILLIVALAALPGMGGKIQAATAQNVTLRTPANMLGLVGYWTMDGKDMVSNVADVSGQNNHGSLVGQSATTTVVGRIGQALELDGSDDWVDAQDPASLAITGQLTISAWVMFDEFSATNQGIAGRFRSEAGNLNQRSYSIIYNPDDTLNFYISGDGTSGSNQLATMSGVAAALGTGKWHHVVGVYVPSTSIKLYVDGVLKATNTTSIHSSLYGGTSRFYMGRAVDSATVHDGRVDDVRVYNRELSVVEIERLYELGEGTRIISTQIGSDEPAVITEIDVLEFDEVIAVDPSLVVIDSSHAMVANQGQGGDGYLRTISFDGSFDNLAIVDTLEHDTTIGTGHSLVKIDATHFIMTYIGGASDGYIKTFSIDGSYVITELDSLMHNAAAFSDSSLVMIDSTHFMAAFKGAQSDGFLSTFSIDGSHVITEIEEVEWSANANVAQFSLVKIDATHFALAYSDDNSGDGHLKIFSIDGSYATITEVGSLEYDTADGTKASMVLVDSTHLILAYAGSLGVGIIKTFSIDGSYNITEVDSLTHDATQGTDNSLVQVDASTYVLAYSGSGTDGFIKVFTIDGSFQITEESVLEHDVSQNLDNSLAKIDATHFAVAYGGVDGDGFIKTLSLSGGETPPGSSDDYVIINKTPTSLRLSGGLIGHWTFDGPQMFTNIGDKSGQNNNGALVGQPATTTAPGRIGQGLELDGVNEDFSISTESNFDFEQTSPFTIAGWFKFDTMPADAHTLFNKLANSSPFRGYELDLEPEGKLRFWLINTFSTNYIGVDTGDGLITTGQWYHIAVTYTGSSDESGITIYINGSAVSHTDFSNTLSATILNDVLPHIGSRQTATFFVDGVIDDMRVYNRQLSATEVKQLYQLAR